MDGLFIQRDICTGDVAMYWIVVIIIVAICTLTGFLVGVAYGQENWHEHL